MRRSKESQDDAFLSFNRAPILHDVMYRIGIVTCILCDSRFEKRDPHLAICYRPIFSSHAFYTLAGSLRFVTFAIARHSHGKPLPQHYTLVRGVFGLMFGIVAYDFFVIRQELLGCETSIRVMATVTEPRRYDYYSCINIAWIVLVEDAFTAKTWVRNPLVGWGGWSRSGKNFFQILWEKPDGNCVLWFKRSTRMSYRRKTRQGNYSHGGLIIDIRLANWSRGGLSFLALFPPYWEYASAAAAAAVTSLHQRYYTCY